MTDKYPLKDGIKQNSIAVVTLLLQRDWLVLCTDL